MSKALGTLVTKIPQFAMGTVEKAKPKLAIFMKYARVELTPPRLSELPEVAAGFGRLMKSAKSGEWKRLTVKEAWLNTLIAMEISFCFFIGECIGKGSLLSYQV